VAGLGHFKAKCGQRVEVKRVKYPNGSRKKRTLRPQTLWKPSQRTHSLVHMGNQADRRWSPTQPYSKCQLQWDLTSYRKYNECRDIKALKINTVKGVGEATSWLMSSSKKTTRIRLTQVMHVTQRGQKILSLKNDQKWFKFDRWKVTFVSWKPKKYTLSLTRWRLYEVKNEGCTVEESVMAAVKRDVTLPTTLPGIGDRSPRRHSIKEVVTPEPSRVWKSQTHHLNGICRNVW